LAALDAALRAARAETERPSLIALRTTIGFGSPNRAGTSEAHGAPLGEEEVRLTREALGYPSPEPFHVPAEAREEWAQARPRGEAGEAEWRARLEAWGSAHPELAREFGAFQDGALPEGWASAIPDFSGLAKPEATRVSSGKVIQGVAA